MDLPVPERVATALTSFGPPTTLTLCFELLLAATLDLLVDVAVREMNGPSDPAADLSQSSDHQADPLFHYGHPGSQFLPRDDLLRHNIEHRRATPRSK